MANQILVVDDVRSTRINLKDGLEKEGFEITEAEDGVEALEQIHKNPPDLVLLDIILPKMDGFQVARALKESKNERYNAIPIIFMTAKKSLVDDRIKNVSGVEEYFVKPFETSELSAKIKKLLNK